MLSPVCRAGAILGLLLVCLVIGVPMAWILSRTKAPGNNWLDALTTTASLLATWLTARKVLESWWWWIVIDGLTAVLFWQQQLPLTALLFLAYTALAARGYVTWRRSMAAA